MGNAFSVRLARPSDTAAIAALLSELNAYEDIDAPCDEAALMTALWQENPPVALRAWVAATPQHLIGTLLAYPGYDTLSASYGYHLADMVVQENYRRQGAGRALMQALAQHTLDEGKAWVSLTALKNNARAQQFYHALGLQEVNVTFFASGKKALSALVAGDA
jgi:ribosomal protein S18 acetylase RimI-like enzyme